MSLPLYQTFVLVYLARVDTAFQPDYAFTAVIDITLPKLQPRLSMILNLIVFVQRKTEVHDCACFMNECTPQQLFEAIVTVIGEIMGTASWLGCTRMQIEPLERSHSKSRIEWVGLRPLILEYAACLRAAPRAAGPI